MVYVKNERLACEIFLKMYVDCIFDIRGHKAASANISAKLLPSLWIKII